jgi:hypothetical protein
MWAAERDAELVRDFIRAVLVYPEKELKGNPDGKG